MSIALVLGHGVIKIYTVIYGMNGKVGNVKGNREKVPRR